MLARALLIVMVGLLAAGCEKDSDDFLVDYQSQQTLLCVSEVQSDQNQQAVYPHCRFAPAFARVECPRASERLDLPTSETWTVLRLRYAAWMPNWEECWMQVESCVSRRDCPETWTVEFSERRLGWDGGLAL